MPAAGYTISYIATAESVAWSGSNGSIDDGFEALLYNPAGIFMTNRRAGLNLFGSYGARVAMNFASSDDVIKVLQYSLSGTNITTNSWLDGFFTRIPHHGTDIAIDVSALNFMSYFKYETFAIGVLLSSKTYSTTLISKSFYSILFDELDIRTPVSFSLNSVLLSYIDLNVALSTRVGFLEELLPVKAVYAGLSFHVYVPLIYARMNISGNMTSIDDGTGVLMPGMRMRGTFSAGGPLLLLNTYVPQLQGFTPNGGFGLGVDMGMIFEVFSFMKIGFAVTDLGFMVLPEAEDSVINITAGLMEMTSVAQTIFSGAKTKVPTGMMPATAIRAGIGFTPLRNKEMLLIAFDVTVGDFNRLVYNEPPSVNIATGIEFKPGFDWFSVPMRFAFCYNTAANFPSFAVGFGLHFGPVEFELGVKGLEFFIPNLGARELVVGFDMKFQF